jgi:hypothetical protein
MIKRFWDWVDERAVVRRIVLAFTLFMTADAVYQAWLFSRVSTFDGLGTAAVIAAVTAPVAALQKFAFDTYAKGREK